jgi:hypothetical protein
MWLTSLRQRITSSDTGPLILSALFLIALHTATNGQYGFHRDELAPSTMPDISTGATSSTRPSRP